MRTRDLLPLVAFVGVLAANPGDVRAGPLCSELGPVSLDSFESCIVEGEQDFLSNVQSALDSVLTNAVTLQGSGSFCPGPECTGSEFAGSDPAEGFVIDPSILPGSTSFTFEQIPAGTLFITLKQGPDFEIFKVPGPLSFTLTHQLRGEDTSHIGTFVAAPEPGALALLGLGGVLGVAARVRRSRSRRYQTFASSG